MIDKYFKEKIKNKEESEKIKNNFKNIFKDNFGCKFKSNSISHAFIGFFKLDDADKNLFEDVANSFILSIRTISDLITILKIKKHLLLMNNKPTPFGICRAYNIKVIRNLDDSYLDKYIKSELKDIEYDLDKLSNKEERNRINRTINKKLNIANKKKKIKNNNDKKFTYWSMYK